MSGESMRHWWNSGVHEKCLSTYCLLVQFNIPERLGLVRSTTLQTNIHGILERIPSISPEGLNAHFCSIDTKLSAYKNTTLLELAIWKTKFMEQIDGNINLLTPDMKIRCRIDSLSMVDIIVPNVLSFLNGDANEGDEGEDDDGDDDKDGGDDENDDSDNDDDSGEEDDDSDEDDGDD